MSSSYAACSEQQSSAIITCLNTDNLPTCLAQNPGCNAQDVDTQITVQELDQRVLGLCCGKSSKGARLGCLNSSKNSLNTPAVKNLVPRAVITEVSADIANAIDSVKSSGICSNGYAASRNKGTKQGGRADRFGMLSTLFLSNFSDRTAS